MYRLTPIDQDSVSQYIQPRFSFDSGISIKYYIWLELMGWDGTAVAARDQLLVLIRLTYRCVAYS